MKSRTFKKSFLVASTSLAACAQTAIVSIGTYTISSLTFIGEVKADLIIYSGRGYRTRNFTNNFYYVEDESLLNEVGVKAELLEDSWGFFEPDKLNAITQQRYVGGGGTQYVQATPAECSYNYSEDEEDTLLNDTIPDIEAFWDYSNYATYEEGEAALAAYVQEIKDEFYGPNEPCIWQFEQGEDISTWGFYNLFFDTPNIDYFVTWNISGANGSWTGSGTVGSDSVFLNVAASDANLLPGDYTISVDVSFNINQGRLFFESPDPDDPVDFKKACKSTFDSYDDEIAAYEAYNDALDAWDPNSGEPEPVEPVYEICGYTSLTDLRDPNWYGEFLNPYIERADIPGSYASSYEEILRILPASADNEVVRASAPATLSIFLTGLGAIYLRRQRKLTHK
ncbi:hypothetical protein [Aestuariibacter salexigens]|uniref:hypothetical protein n=1 Tax=Aestuariibacter salexigens TaxID=226010 RepID=UPI000478BE2F|nr:hypothetical protein [Aestuariibacter salexigens]